LARGINKKKGVSAIHSFFIVHPRPKEKTAKKELPLVALFCRPKRVKPEYRQRRASAGRFLMAKKKAVFRYSPHRFFLKNTQVKVFFYSVSLHKKKPLPV